MTIGNDVIDLNLDLHSNPRFPKRVLNNIEYGKYSGLSRDEKVYFLAKCWAAKEAAYKCLKQVDSTIDFSPKLFEVEPDFSALKYNGVLVKLRYELQKRYIHCTATPWGKEPFSIGISTLQDASLLTIPLTEKETKSAPHKNMSFARRLAKRHIKDAYGVPFDQIHIEKSSFGIPKAVTSIGDISISLSHDGDYVAVATYGLAR